MSRTDDVVDQGALPLGVALQRVSTATEAPRTYVPVAVLDPAQSDHDYPARDYTIAYQAWHASGPDVIRMDIAFARALTEIQNQQEQDYLIRREQSIAAKTGRSRRSVP